MGKRRSSRRPASGKETSEIELRQPPVKRDKPFTCSHCEKFFAQKAALKVHIRTHTGERLFICNICEKRFSRADHLHQHIRTHTGEKPHACTECDKSFATWSAVSRHRAEHFSQRKFKCSICPKEFSRADNYRSHMSRKHRLNQEPSDMADSDDHLQAVKMEDNETAYTEDNEFIFGPHFLTN